MNKLTINYSEKEGKILPLHAVNCAPYNRSSGASQPLVHKLFSEAHIPYSRLHDCCGAYGGCYYVDVPNIFRNFDADENDEANYDFHYTDEYLAAIVKGGAEPYYRLGVTIEHGSKKYTIHPPKDYAKWARICEHIIRHYNEGWANGFHYGIKYWEIWNEPENPPMWTGTREEFYELYRVASKHLRACFGDSIKIGGYGHCGFYAVNRPNASDFQKSFIPYFTDFLAICRDEKLPLDFFSWHIYSTDPDEVVIHAKYCRDVLDEYGFGDTEAHLNEWNYHGGERPFKDKHTMVGAAFLCETMLKLAKAKTVDMAHYYVFSLAGMYVGLLDQNDRSVDVPYYVLKAYGDLYAIGEAVKAESTNDKILTLAAANDDNAAMMVFNASDEDERVLIETVGGEYTAYSIRELTENSKLTDGTDFAACGNFEIKVPSRTMLLITANK